MNAVGAVLILGGVFFLTVSAIGVLRLPDFFSRTHAAGKSETLGALLILIGLAAHQGFDFTSFKLLLIVFIVAVTSPTAVHALTRAALRSGMDLSADDSPPREAAVLREAARSALAEPEPAEGVEAPGR